MKLVRSFAKKNTKSINYAEAYYKFNNQPKIETQQTTISNYKNGAPAGHTNLRVYTFRHYDSLLISDAANYYSKLNDCALVLNVDASHFARAKRDLIKSSTAITRKSPGTPTSPYTQ
jgi:hypothetical protein